MQELNRKNMLLTVFSSFLILASTRSLPELDGIVRPTPGFFALVAFLLLAVVAALTLSVLGFRRGFWVEKKLFLAVLAVPSFFSLLVPLSE